MPSHQQRLSWRTRRSSRALATFFCLGSAGGVAVDGVFITRSEPLWSGLLLVGIAGLLVWFFAYRPLVKVEGTQVMVRNPLRKYVFDLEKVEDVSPGYFGLEFRRQSGRTIRAWAVQKANVAWMSGRSTRADAVAETLQELAGAPSPPRG